MECTIQHRTAPTYCEFQPCRSPLRHETCPVHRKNLPCDDYPFARCTRHLGNVRYLANPSVVSRGLQTALLQFEKYEEAKRIAEEWARILQRTAPPNPTQLARAETSLAAALLGVQQYEDAGERVSIALDTDEIEATQRLRATSINGAVLAADANWEEAEPLLINSAEELAQQLADLAIGIRWYVPRAHDRVIALYEAWGKPDKVAEWKAKLADINAEIERLQNRNEQATVDAADDSQAKSEESTEEP